MLPELVADDVAEGEKAHPLWLEGVQLRGFNASVIRTQCSMRSGAVHAYEHAVVKRDPYLSSKRTRG